MGCKICGESPGPVCYTCRQILGSLGGVVETALLLSENARRRADQQLEAERASHAATAGRERKVLAELRELRDEYAALSAELGELRSALGQVTIGRAAATRLLPAPALRPPRISTPGAPAGLHVESAAPPPVGGNAAGTPSTVGRRAEGDPTTPPPPTEDKAPEDPASARYSLLELD